MKSTKQNTNMSPKSHIEKCVQNAFTDSTCQLQISLLVWRTQLTPLSTCRKSLKNSRFGGTWSVSFGSWVSAIYVSTRPLDHKHVTKGSMFFWIWPKILLGRLTNKIWSTTRWVDEVDGYSPSQISKPLLWGQREHFHTPHNKKCLSFEILPVPIFFVSPFVSGQISRISEPSLPEFMSQKNPTFQIKIVSEEINYTIHRNPSDVENMRSACFLMFRSQTIKNPSCSLKKMFCGISIPKKHKMVETVLSEHHFPPKKWLFFRYTLQ